MKIETRFSNGDTVYIIQGKYPSGTWEAIGPLTIGQVRVEITSSPGIEGETMFDNYKAQEGRLEQYMCVETGIGTGTLYRVERMFSSLEEAQDEAKCKTNLTPTENDLTKLVHNVSYVVPSDE